jgi:hypothetical protein
MMAGASTCDRADRTFGSTFEDAGADAAAVAVLPAEGDPAAGKLLRHLAEVGKRGADQQVAVELRAFGLLLQGRRQGFGTLGEAVHLPVTGNQSSHRRFPTLRHLT